MTLKSPETRITSARTRLLLDFPWFGSLAMRLRIMPAEVPTFATNGTDLKYSPAFLAKLSDAELLGVLAHEVMHCALLHMFRRGNRDLKKWNVATDYAINGELTKCGFTLPSDCLLDSQYDGLPAEVIYARLPDQPQQSTGQGPNGEQSTGQVEDAPQPQSQSGHGQQPGTSQTQTMTETDWKIATEQASDVSKGCGNLPDGVARLAKDARKNVADWREILREFIAHTVNSETSWMRPNRRFAHSGLYLPGVVKENMGPIAIAVDTSGSISSELLAKFGAEIQTINRESQPEKITVLYCDAQINRTDEFTAEDEVKLVYTGGGGTRFSPVFDAVNQWEELPACLVYFTDLECWETISQPDYPVLWCTPMSVTKSGQFGVTVRVE